MHYSSFSQEYFGSPVQMAVRGSRFLGIRKGFTLQIEDLWKDARRASFQGLDETLVRDPLRKNYGRYWKGLDFPKFVDPWAFRWGKLNVCVCMHSNTCLDWLDSLAFKTEGRPET